MSLSVFVLFLQIGSDSSVNHTVYYMISGPGVDEDPVGVISVDLFGMLRLHRAVDREKYPQFTVSEKEMLVSVILFCERTVLFSVSALLKINKVYCKINSFKGKSKSFVFSLFQLNGVHLIYNL